jgi:hypothetical protein
MSYIHEARYDFQYINRPPRSYFWFFTNTVLLNLFILSIYQQIKVHTTTLTKVNPPQMAEVTSL